MDYRRVSFEHVPSITEHPRTFPSMFRTQTVNHQHVFERGMLKPSRVQTQHHNVDIQMVSVHQLLDNVQEYFALHNSVQRNHILEYRQNYLKDEHLLQCNYKILKVSQIQIPAKKYF